MANDPISVTYCVHVHDEGVDGLWADVEELPGCFASGATLDELNEALREAIGMYLSTPESPIEISAMVPVDEVERVEVQSFRLLTNC